MSETPIVTDAKYGGSAANLDKLVCFYWSLLTSLLSFAHVTVELLYFLTFIIVAVNEGQQEIYEYRYIKINTSELIRHW